MAAEGAAGVGAGQLPPDFLYKQLSRFPNKLLKWFGVPMGQNPQVLEASYQPILDLWDWLACSPGNHVLEFSTGVAVGGATVGTVILFNNIQPMLYVRDYTIRTQPIPAGGGDWSIAPSIQPFKPSGTEVLVGRQQRTNLLGAATVGETVTAYADRPFFVGGFGSAASSSAIGGIIQTNTVAGAFQALGYMRYVNLET
jgi:hypothetical protein